MGTLRTNRLVLIASVMTDMNPSPAPSGASAAAEKPAAAGRLLGAADIRHIAAEAGISPTKKFGQNFVIDPGTVRRIVREAAVTADTRVLEVGPGLGSLTLAILETGATMTAVEIDPPVAQRLRGTASRSSTRTRWPSRRRTSPSSAATNRSPWWRTFRTMWPRRSS